MSEESVPPELRGLRAFLFAVTLFQPLLFVSSESQAPDRFDPWEGRAAMTALSAIALAATYLSPWSRRNVHSVALGVAFAMQGYLLLLAGPNNLQFEFFVGLVMTTAVMQTLCRSLTELGAFALLTLGGAAVSHAFAPSPHMDLGAVMTILGALIGAVGFMLSHRSRLERELRQTSVELESAVEEIRELDALKTRFFANVSHELRTPLQLILGPLDPMIRGEAPPGGTAPALRSMQRNARRLHHLIDQLLDLARVDAGAERLSVQPVRPAALLESVARSFGPAAEGAGVRLVVSDPDQLGAHELDPHWLESALTNLVANAVRHCDPGATIELSVTRDGAFVVMAVADTGPGIPADDLPRIFDRFAQSAQREGASRGTGIGLAIVREAARLHGGDAEVSSVLGQGTTFRLRLSAAATTDQATTPLERSPAPSFDDTPRVPRWMGPEGAPLVVVADDEPDLRQAIAHTLAASHRVLLCEDGEDAWEAVQEHRPALVVSDLSMPRRTGMELCAAIRAHPQTAAIPFVLLTAHRAQDTVLDAFDAGISDYVTKPFHARELIARCEVQLRLVGLQRDALVRERYAALGTLAGEVAHHVRNPLNLIVNGLPVIERALPEAHAARKLIRPMRTSASRIVRMTTDLLQLGGQAATEAIPHRPWGSLRSIAELLQERYETRARITVGDGPPGLALASPGDLNQAFLLLLDGAVGLLTDSPEILVRGEPDLATWSIVVEGASSIDSAALPTLFDAQLSAAGVPDGVALGLASAAALVREQGGNLVAERSSEIGSGRVRLRLSVPREEATHTHGPLRHAS